MVDHIKIFTITVLLTLSAMASGAIKLKPTAPARLGGVSEHISYTQIYDFVEELAEQGVISVNSATMPYDRRQIAAWLAEAHAADSVLSRRQRSELRFFMNDYGLELDTIPSAIVNWTDHRTFSLGLLQPAFHYNSILFKAKINPIIGMNLLYNRHGLIIHRWWGAELRADIANHVAIWGSIRDNSYLGSYLDKEFYSENHIWTGVGAQLAGPRYLNREPGAYYHTSSYSCDFADVRAGVKFYTDWGSIALVKDNVRWGDSYAGSNIFSGRAPSFPMIELKLKPCPWFRLDYIHGYLSSGVIDSTKYYEAVSPVDTSYSRGYKMQAKYLAANMLTFTPIRGLDISIGSAVVYANPALAAAFSIPVQFFNSTDFQMSSAMEGVENENSQIFFNISTRNLPFTHFYATVYADEISFKRLKKGSKEHNFISYKVGGRVSNWPVKDLSLTAEFTRTNSGCYQHPYKVLAYTSNGYNLGHYLGDNSQEIYVALGYKPIRSLSLLLSYTNATKYNEYLYTRWSNPDKLPTFISQPQFAERVWRNDEVRLHTVYEVVNNAYAVVDLTWNNARGFDPTSEPTRDELRLTASEYLRRYTPAFYWGSCFTVKCGFSFYF